jgi:hypothetical protein
MVRDKEAYDGLILYIVITALGIYTMRD